MLSYISFIKRQLCFQKLKLLQITLLQNSSSELIFVDLPKYREITKINLLKGRAMQII